MKIKKVIAVILGITIPVGAIAGGISGYKSYQEKKLIAEVQPVSNINWGYYGDSETSYGMVTNDSSQEIYLSDAKKVKQVYVQEGDIVSVGDPLLEYDTSELRIEIERKKLDISTVENNIAIASHVLEQLKIAKPVDKTPPKLDKKKIEELELEDKKNNTVSERDAKDNRIYNFVTASSLPYNMKTDPATGELVYPAGTEEEPYIYYCNRNAYIYGSFFNSIRPKETGEAGKHAVFYVCKKDENGKMVLNGAGTGQESTENTEKPSGTESTENTEKPSGTESTESTEKTSGTESTESTEKPSGTESTENTEKPSGSVSTENTEKPSGSTRTESGNPGKLQDGAESAIDTKTPSASGSTESNEDKPGGSGGTQSPSGTENTGIPVVDSNVSPNMVSFDGSKIPADYDIDQTWYAFTGKEYVPKSALDEYMEEFMEHASEWELPDGYTKEEIIKEAQARETELKSLDIKKRKLELQLRSLENTAADGMVYATVDGVVKTAGDPDEFREDGTAFLVVTGDDGLYVSGSISELLLQDIRVGTVVTANSWESGMTFDATITEISDYPAANNSWGDGNPNVSYYSYTAYIEDSSSLRNGEYLDLSISTNQSETGGLFIEKAYVREEDGKSYVMIADENNRLKKQYVVTGRTVYGSAVEIKSGLSEDDRIAFPYGKEAVEGVTVEDASNGYN